MSDFRFACPHCGQRISGDSVYRGRQIACPSCQKDLTVPAPAKKAAIAPTRSPEPGPAAGTGPMSALALTSLVCAAAPGIGSIAGIVCGHLARRRMRSDPALGGRRLALAGLSLSYFSLVVIAAFFTLGFTVLAPKTGRQIPKAEQEASAAAIVGRRVDEVKPGDPESETAHKMAARMSNSVKFMDKSVRDAVNGGFVSYVMKVDPAQPMSLYCTYWGNDSVGRRFDILVEDEVIATQRLDFNDPGHFFDVEYRIPGRLTRGKTEVTVVFQAYPRNTVGGIFGCQMLKR
jgi:hypothetical protein